VVGVGYSCELFEKLIYQALNDNVNYLLVRVCLLAAGIVILCFSCSLFFTSNVGVGAYDALGFMLSNKIKVQYKWVRVFTDVTVVLIGLIVSGGLVAMLKGNLSQVKNIGIGTIISAFMTGPLVNFFSKHVSSKILKVDYVSLSKDVAFFMLKGAMLKNSTPVAVNPTELNFNSNAYEVLK
jgi:uncharacterized membrane protein YczE